MAMKERLRGQRWTPACCLIIFALVLAVSGQFHDDYPLLPRSNSEEHMKEGFHYIKGIYKRYRFFFYPVDWKTAFITCTKWEAHLIIIEGEENLWIHQYLNNVTKGKYPEGKRRFFHGGYHNLFHYKVAQTIFGAERGFLMWDKTVNRREDLMFPSPNHCIRITLQTYLIPAQCDEKFPFMCEKCEVMHRE